MVCSSQHCLGSAELARSMEHMNFLQEREISAVERDSDDDVRGEDDEYLRGVSGGADGGGEVAPAVSYSGMRSHHNTGPKGVLADYREHQAKMVRGHARTAQRNTPGRQRRCRSILLCALNF